MKQYVSLPIEQLVSDVPVDPMHTKELADSIKSRGQLNPVIVREETKEVIDGFHRVAAMAELGFDRVECVLTPCDDEGFWDFRIIQASLHKNVTFARAVDWIEKVFEMSSLRKHWEHGGGREYKSVYSVFASYTRANPPKEVKEWVEAKSAMWGLTPRTIQNWLYTKQALAPELLKEATSPFEGEVAIPSYHAVAEGLPHKPELQKRIIEKAKVEDLSTKDVRTLAQALRRSRYWYKKHNVTPPSRLERKKPPKSIAIPFRISSNPLCGEDWLRAHLTDHTPKEISALTIEIGYDSRWLPPVSVSDKRGTTKTIIKNIPRGKR